MRLAPIVRSFALLASPLLLLGARAQNWHTVEWDASQFTALSGDMLVPSLPPPGGTPYVWPGLQPGSAGVLQAVLDGRSGAWWIGDGYYGTPSLPWGAGFNAAPGETVHFTFALGSNDTWTCTLSSSSGASASTTLAITGQTMNRRVPRTTYMLHVPRASSPLAADAAHRIASRAPRAILAVELYDIAYTFGPTVYRNLVLTATTAASGWCGKTVSSGYTAGQYTVTGATASGNTCRVSEVIMPSAS